MNGTLKKRRSQGGRGGRTFQAEEIPSAVLKVRKPAGGVPSLDEVREVGRTPRHRRLWIGHGILYFNLKNSGKEGSLNGEQRVWFVFLKLSGEGITGRKG